MAKSSNQSLPKQGLNLDRVVLLGRTLEEYAQFFGLDVEALRGKKILDVAGGVSSFTAEARAKGIEVTAFDRIYGADAEEIQKRCEHDLGEVASAIGSKAVYCWDFYKTPEGMRAFRERAYKTFVADFRKRPGWHVAGELPRLPFAGREFDLTLVSYLLLVYEEQLSYEFHLDTLRELMRVTRGEIRIYPIVTFEAEPSKYLVRLQKEPDFEGWNFEVIATGFEFLRGSAFYLRVKNARAQARQAGASGAILPAR